MRLEFGKRDFIWIGLLIILVGVGFVYGYNSGLSPSVMGHSIEELEGVALNSDLVVLRDRVDNTYSKYYVVPMAEIAMFHDGCVSSVSDSKFCVAACNRYCQDSCAKFSGIFNCNGGESGLNYAGGTLVEISGAAGCLCIN